MANLPSGTYEVWLYIFEDNASASFSFTVEETSVGTIYNSGNGGSWYKVGPFVRTISDGALNVAVTAGNDALLSGLEVLSVSETPTPPVGEVPDHLEIAALKEFYFSLDGPNWVDVNWPSTEQAWSEIQFVEQMHDWTGVGLTNGDITELMLRGKRLRGNSIPISIGNLAKLEGIDISGSQLSPTNSYIPSITHLRQLVNLKYLAAYSVSLSTMPDFGTLQQLITLELSTNPLMQKTTLPSWLRNLENLEELGLNEANLTGEIPEWLGELQSLVVLRLVGNNLSGELPEALANVSNVWLMDNKLSGPIPTPFFFGDITFLGLRGNNLTGSIPNLDLPSALIYLGLDNNQMSGELPYNWQNLQYVNLSGNQFSGEVPSTLMTNFPGYADLSKNRFTSLSSSFWTGYPGGTIHLEENYLSLEALTPIANISQNSEIYYSPQRAVPDPSTVTVEVGSPLTFSGGFGQTSWEKLQGTTWVSAPSVIQQAQFEDTGKFRWKSIITTPIALTALSDDITVYVTQPADNTPVERKYNGLITAMRWRTDEVYETTGGNFTGMYLYSYDDKYQITDARFADNIIGPNFSVKSQYRMTGMQYDPNGNIKALQRFDENGVRVNNFVYHYEDEDAVPMYNNKLKKVDGHVNAYEYNKLGQMTKADNVEGADQYPEYDVTGKVKKVYDGPPSGPRKLIIENLYDDRGFRLAKITFSGSEARTTWYIRDASGNVISIHEQKGIPSEANAEPFVQTEVPLYGSGKLGSYYPAQDASVSYEITDHLGNVRALLREGVMEFTATMEDNNVEEIENPRVQEMAYFQNLFETEVNDPNMNHTSNTATVVQNPSRSAYLFWQDGMPGMESEDKSIGPAIAREVSAGDIITAEAFVRYEDLEESYENNLNLALLSSFLGNSFVSVGGFEGYTLEETTQSFSGALGGFPTENGGNSMPYAYLNYIIFNKDMVSIDAKRKRVSEDAGFEPAEAGIPDQHERVFFENAIVIPPAGKYIYLWVSNETENTRVWFDDFKVTHSGVFVAQATDYGVWGDVLREQKSDVLEKYRYAYQGQFAERDEETGWNHFELREYDAAIARWTAPDPYGQYWSPYIGMSNNPVSGLDPNGGYSQFGATWRNVFYGGKGIYESGGEWGFNTGNGLDGVVPHFGDERSVASGGDNQILDRASSDFDQMVSSRMPIPDRIIADRGGDGIEPFYFVTTPEELAQPLVDLVQGNYSDAALAAAFVFLPGKSPKKADFLFKSRSQAMNWARQKLGHNTTKMYDNHGKWIGLINKKGDSVYWGHGDWGKGMGSSTFPHLNYSFDGGRMKGHLFLENKILNRGQLGDFNLYFNR
jgi:RHS repeat-associated protein